MRKSSPRIKFSNEQIYNIIQLYTEENRSLKYIGRVYNVSFGTIRKLLQSNGIEIKDGALLPSKEVLLINDYLNGTGIKELCLKYHIGYGTCYNIFNKYNINFRLRNLPFNEQQQFEICELYSNGYSGVDLSYKYNTTCATIYLILKKNNIIIRSLSDANRMYECDESYFDNIDCEEKAYIFGLLFADGNLYDSQYSYIISLGLQECDSYLIYKINNIIQPSKPVEIRNLNDKNKKHQNMYNLTIISNHMGEVLNSYGLVPRKSLVKKFPEVILNSNEDIIRHFIRGYFDGNGSIGITYRSKCNKMDYRISICSTLSMCESFRNIFKLYCNTTNGYIRTFSNTNIKEFVLGGRLNVLKVCNWLYEDSNICMTRKFEIFKEINQNEFR